MISMTMSEPGRRDKSAQRSPDGAREKQAPESAIIPPRDDVFRLQRTIGNQATGRLLQRRFDAARTPSMSERPVIQRYAVIKSGDDRYPVKKEFRRLLKNKDASGDEDFFISQEERDGSYFGKEKGANDKYGPNLVRKSNADLMVSDQLDLAIEDTSGEPKVFFATKERVNEANELLQGKVRLKMTGKILQITSEGGTKMLYQVIPVVPDKKEQGLDVKTPQRCNEAAQFITGAIGLDLQGNRKVYQLMTELLKRVTGRDFVGEYTEAYNLAVDTGKTNALLAIMDEISTEFRRVKDDAETIEIMKELNMNEYMMPKIGDAVTTFGIATAAEESVADKSEIFMYHFAGVVARSGSDYITMENYARRDEKGNGTLSGGDPLYFFKMHGSAESEKNWHNNMLGTGNFIGAAISFVVS